ncbi:MAG: trigger factor [Spirochaetales bacterium]|nr:trigger factor [Spirochaetales bacterium]
MEIANKEIKHLGNSRVELTATIPASEAEQVYKDLVKKYAKTVQVKGFRKGKVPPEVLERKFGDEIKAESMGQLIEESLKQIFEEIDEVPLSSSQPELKNDEEIGLEPGKDFTYTVAYDIYPEVELGDYSGLSAERPKVSVEEEDLQRELEQLQERNSLVVDKKEDSAVTEDDIVTVDYVELDEEGSPKEDTKREAFVFTVGTGQNIYQFDEEIKGMKNGEEKTFTKTFPEDFENEDLAGTTRAIKVNVTAVKQKEIPELDDDFAQDVSENYETLDDLKKDITERLENTAENKTKDLVANSLMDQIVENSSVEIPESMIQAELDSSWQNFAYQYRIPEDQLEAILEQEGKGKEDLYQEWRPSVEKRLKSRLLMNEMIKQEGIEVTDEEVDEELTRIGEGNNLSLEDIKQRYEQANMLNYLKNEIADKKLFDILIEKADIKEGKEMKYLDLVEQNS